MPVRSMTGYAQLTHQVSDRTSFSLSLKSVNHRFLDLHFRIPLEANPLELKMRRILKEKIARGHIEVALSLQQGDAGGFQLNHALVEGYVRAFQEAAERLGIVAQPDLNVILRTPGALSGDSTTLDETTEQVILEQLEQLIERLNHMREEEGRGVDREEPGRGGAVPRARVRSPPCRGHGRRPGVVLRRLRPGDLVRTAARSRAARAPLRPLAR